jgi:hypothetical protein
MCRFLRRRMSRATDCRLVRRVRGWPSIVPRERWMKTGAQESGSCLLFRKENAITAAAALLRGNAAPWSAASGRSGVRPGGSGPCAWSAPSGAGRHERHSCSGDVPHRSRAPTRPEIARSCHWDTGSCRVPIRSEGPPRKRLGRLRHPVLARDLVPIRWQTPRRCCDTEPSRLLRRRVPASPPMHPAPFHLSNQRRVDNNILRG